MEMPNFSLEGRVALVTGVRRGIEKAIALAMAEADVAVFLASDASSYVPGHTIPVDGGQQA